MAWPSSGVVTALHHRDADAGPFPWAEPAAMPAGICTVQTVREGPAGCGQLRTVPELQRYRARSTWPPGWDAALVRHRVGLGMQPGPVAADTLGIRRTNGKVVAVK